MNCRLLKPIVVALLAGCLAPADSLWAAPPAVSFELDVVPVLTARGCNQGACHGKARGQNGFQLSLLGFDPEFDYDALAKNARGRRVFPASPEQSLLLRKGTGELPHGGGVRLPLDGDDYRVLRDWIAAGLPRHAANEPTLTKVEVEPVGLTLRPEESRPLRVTAHYSDGTQRDVTARTSYQSSESGVVGVSEAGLVQVGPLPGEATIMARYMNVIATCDVVVPLPGEVPDDYYASLPRRNFIDEHVWAKLQTLGITPSAPCDDATFLRRAHLDLIGRLPTPDEVRRFLADPSSDKRAALVDELLERPEYADHWAGKWADLLRPNPYRVGVKAVWNYDSWIRDSFRSNKPYDQFVRELVAAQGSTWRNGAATLFRDRRDPDEIATLISQLFLGVRLECAKCHHHPFERWSQDDFYSFAAFFAQVGRKGTGLSPPISGSEEIVFAGKRGEVRHPLTQEVLAPRVLFGDTPEWPAGGDPREALAAWITADDNPYFTQVIVNRVWGDLLGRGLVDPIDDLRATNPPSNAALLVALADQFRDDGYDLKKLLRWIAASHVYQLSSEPTERNAADRRNFSRHYRQRLRAEVLADAVSDITGQDESFAAMPAGSRSNQLWTTRVQSVFLDTFGRPNPNQDPPCERLVDATMTQALHLMNSPALHQKVTSDRGSAARLAASPLSAEELVEEIYLLVYSRPPDDEERAIGRAVFDEAGSNRRQATEDLMWALINTPEFIFVN